VYEASPEFWKFGWREHCVIASAEIDLAHKCYRYWLESFFWHMEYMRTLVVSRQTISTKNL
jgi:hypothetical protein